MVVIGFKPISESSCELDECLLVIREFLQLLLLVLDQSIPEAEATVEGTGLFGSVTNQQLFFDTVVEIAGLLERPDVDLKEDREPTQLYKKNQLLSQVQKKHDHIHLQICRIGEFARSGFAKLEADS